MAMVARSQRKMLANSLTGTGANPDLGPGTYVPSGGSNYKAGVDTFSTPQKTNAVHFNSSEERQGVSGGSKFVTPGPGRYIDRDRPTAAEVINNSMSSSTFASNSIRFNPKALNPGMPGPGQYMAGETIGDKAKKTLAKALTSTAGGFGSSQPSISWKRMSTAPSIPGKGQSFGFRKSADSGVVPLKPKKAKAAPTPVDPTAPKHIKGVEWSKSKTDRFKPKKSDAYPSPSQGEERSHSRAAPSRNRMRPPEREGPSYAEMLARKKLEEAAAVPGPGSYAPPVSDFEVAANANAGPFNVTAKRFSEKVTTGDLGPGEYTDGIEKQTKAINIKEKHPASLHTTPFGVTAGRFGKQSVVGQAMEGATPGPGSYTGEDTGFLSAQQDRHFGRFEGGFGSATERFPQAVQQYSADVGPGAYEGRPDPEVQAQLGRRRHRGGLSSLDSGVSREKVIRKSLNITNAANEPAPGDYAIETEFGVRGPPGRADIPQVAETPFGITVKRWGDGKTKSTTNNVPKPAPGTYDVPDHKKTLPYKGRNGQPVTEALASFGSNSERFPKRAAGEGRRTRVPGPGEYTDGVKAATTKWRTPTFNVSIKRTEANAKIVEVL